MNVTQVMELLQTNQNERGIQHWNQDGSRNSNLRSYGIGLTVLRKLAKQIGRDHVLSQQLWDSEVYDARIVALLIDDPKQMTRAQAEVQVEELDHGQLAHVFSSCDATLAKTSFVVALLCDWIKSNDTMRRSCGYGLLYEVSKSKKKNAPDDAFFLEYVNHISESFSSENRTVQGSMGGALLGIGKRSKRLNAAALKVARTIGPIQFESEKRNCEPFDVAKHLTSDYITKKLGL